MATKSRCCSVEGCERPHAARSLCGKHIQRWYAQNPGDRHVTHLVELEAIVGAADTDECILWHRRCDATTGYGVVSVDTVPHGAHAVACALVHGPCPPGQQAAHGRGDGTPCISRACINPRHLRWATAKENAADRRLHGATFHKLTEEQVRDIRRRHAAGEPILRLSKSFDVGRRTIQCIVRRLTWDWLPEA